MTLYAFILLSWQKFGKGLNNASARWEKQAVSVNDTMTGSGKLAAFPAGTQDILPSMNTGAKVDAQAPLPIFDPQLGVQLTFGDRETWYTILGMLFDSLPDYSANLIAAKHDPEELRQAAHKLASASSYCGTPAMNDAAKRVERLAKTGSVDSAAKALDVLLQQIERLQALKHDGNLPEGKDQVY
ncbi:MAG TPA: Hpt domain-containing protein [Sulfuriferula sp.]|nr:Hpt domain-containing protein [Sulfuriferula sp.]